MRQLKSGIYCLFLLLTFSGLLFPIKKGNEKNSASGTSGKMILIPSGIYIPLMKKNNEIDKIKVHAFYLDKFPVTNAQFLEFVKQNQTWRKSKVKRIFADASYLKHWKSDLELGSEVLPNSPVINISWFAARAYAKWRNKRLPTINEWEYAASVGSRSSDINKEDDIKKQILDWYSKPENEIKEVGKSKPNFFGVFDLYGLGWEWVEDFNSVLEAGDSRDDFELNRNLFCASGSYGSLNPTDYASFMRYAFRSSLKANYTIAHLGFRCAKDK